MKDASRQRFTAFIPSRKGLLAVALTLGTAAVLPLFLNLAVSQETTPVGPGAGLPDLGTLKTLNTASGPQEEELQDFNLNEAAKGRILLLTYWMPGEKTSEGSLVDLATWARGKEEVVTVGIVPPRGKTARQAAQRVLDLGLDIPVIWDEGYKLQRTLRAGQVPFIAVVDTEGVVRILGAYNLRHKVLEEITLNSYLDTALTGGGHPTISKLPRHYPVTEFIDKPYFDFTLNAVPSNKVIRFSDYVGDGKLTLLVFWSPDCGHCKEELPELNTYYQKHQDALNIIGIVKVPNEGVRQRTSDFIRIHNIGFPTVDDRAYKVFDRYRVRTTPTTVVVNPKGLVDMVFLGSNVDLEEKLGERMAEVKKTEEGV